MSLAFTGGMVGWGSIASSSIIPSEIIGDYIQSLSTATASSESVTSDVSFRVGGAKQYSGAYIYLNTTSPEYERKYVGQTISDTSDLVGITIKKVRWRGQRYNGANGAIECGFSTRSAFCGNGTIQTSFGSITLSGSNAERNWDFTHSGSGYTIPNACTILVLKSSTNNGGFFKVPYAGANSNDFEDSSTFSSGGKGGASADAIDNDATCNVTCSQTHTRNVADLYLYYDLTEGGSYSIDSSTTNKWKSNSEATPTLTVDMGSAIDLTDLAIFPHSDTTVTTLGIEISTDNSTFTEMKEVETSDLTNGQWNFIGLSTGISARYVRIKSKDSSNAVLAINEVKVRNTDNSTYTPDMTSDTNWLDTVSARIDNNTSTGKIDFDVHRTDTNQALSYDLGTALSNTAWTLRYKMTVDTITQVSDANRMFMGMRSISASSNASTNSDFIGWHSKVGRTGGGVDFKEFHYMTTDGSSMDIEGTTSSVVPTTTTYYITITRKTATTWSLRISTSADYTGGTLHDDISCASGTQGLQYLWIGNVGVSGGSSARFMGTIEDVKIYDGVTSL